MGRRPNTWVTEFFERGEKLADSSNRYQQTCRKCGEEFVKGRNDRLARHLIRSCPNVGDTGRQRVSQQIQLDSSRRSNKKSVFPNTTSKYLPEDVGIAQVSPSHEQSALDTLAEVSRRHLDLSSQAETDPDDPEPEDRASNEVIAEQALIAELRIYVSSVPHPETDANVDSLITTAGQNSLLLLQTEPIYSRDPIDANVESTEVYPLIDPQLQDRNCYVPDLNGSFADHNLSTMTWATITASTTQESFGRWTMPGDSPTPGIGLSQKPTNTKKRGRFDDVRRKEVSDIRKQGACIRCRMLKKPCSGETPCSTCRAVESARVWKTKCLRSRLAEEFNLWSHGLFASRSTTEALLAAPVYDSTPLSGRIEARLFPQSSHCIALAPSTLLRNDNATNNDVISNSNPKTEVPDVVISDQDETLIAQLHEYVHQVAATCIEQEPANFMRITLRRVWRLAQTELGDAASATEDCTSTRSPRSCYTLQNLLLRNVVELSILTGILTSSEKVSWYLQYTLDQSPIQQPDKISGTPAQSQTHPGYILQTSSNYDRIYSRLLVVAEARCSLLSKTIMNELERRLLQRQQASRFGTFLAAIILLSCVERMTAFYQALGRDGNGGTHTQNLGQKHASNELNDKKSISSDVKTTSDTAATGKTDLLNFWPLPAPPSSFWPQGQHFAELLVMLLRMRGLPPKTYQRPDGTLGVLFTLPENANDASAKRQLYEQTKTYADWLDPLQLNVEELVKKRDGPLPRREDGFEAWEMRFVSQLLLPERVK